jgi:hypothetical protein
MGIKARFGLFCLFLILQNQDQEPDEVEEEKSKIEKLVLADENLGLEELNRLRLDEKREPTVEKREIEYETRELKVESPALKDETRSLDGESLMLEALNRLVLVEKSAELVDEKRARDEAQNSAIHLPRRVPMHEENEALMKLQEVIQRDMGLGVLSSNVAIAEFVRCLFILSDKELRWQYSLPLFYDQIWHHAILNTLDYPLLCYYASTCFSELPATQGSSVFL